MATSARKIIGKNVKSIRKALGLSQLNFSILTGLSKGTVFNIESGKSGYNIDLIDNITSCTKYTLQDLSNSDFSPHHNLREILLSEYEGQMEYTNILNTVPEISYAVNFKLLQSSFLNHPKEINEIRSFFDKLGWNYKGTSLSNALKKMTNIIEIKPHESKGNTNVYLKKKRNN